MSDPIGQTNQSYEWYEGLAGAYALGALTTAERTDFERYLAGSQALQAEVNSLMPGVKSLAFLPSEAAPSTGLRDRVFAAISAEPNFVASPAVRPAPVSTRPLPTSLADVRAARGWVINPLYGKIAAALAILLVGSLLAWNFSLRGDNGSETKVLAQLGPLDPANDTGASGDVKYQSDDNVLLLDINNLPALADNEVYELWFIINDGSAPVPAITFRPDASGHGQVAIAADPDNFDLVALTREPGPIGSSAPTTSPFLAASV